MLRVMRLDTAYIEHEYHSAADVRPSPLSATAKRLASATAQSDNRKRRRTVDSSDSEPPDDHADAEAQAERARARERAAIQAYARSQAQAYLHAQKMHDEANAQRRQLYLPPDELKPVAPVPPTVSRGIRVQDLLIAEPPESPEQQHPGTTLDHGTPSRKLSYSVEASPEAEVDARPYRCDIHGCERKFKKLNGLIAHHQAAHTSADPEDPKPFKCNVAGCDNSYKNSNGLAYHLENAHAGGGNRATSKPPSQPSTPQPKESQVEKPWNCPYNGCDKTYKNLKGLAYHLQKGKATGHMVPSEKVAGLNVYICAITTCGKTYKTPQSLVEHVEVSHADMEPLIVPTVEEPEICKIIECPSCMRPFKSERGLADHIALIHHKASPPMLPAPAHLATEVFALSGKSDVEFTQLHPRHSVTATIECLSPIRGRTFL
ncbi:hypothetical protein BDZ88DRAFT_418384 [Geranomyces variabilis]|nr:hypothetical protein BDZ88DRAFT_418384 [Geranomyces variabilis]KAJ3133297.1 hypothetical protein HDU90_006245 [Geranomyces variabilis]